MDKNRMHQDYPDTETIIGESYDCSCRRLFIYIKNNGYSSFEEGGAMFKWREKGLLDNMIEYFQGLEEYEKCHLLLDISNKIQIHDLKQNA